MPESTDADRIAILAAAKSPAPGKAWPAMKSDMVKPMPASAPAPASCRHEYAAGFSASPDQTATADAATRPSGLPSTSPATIARTSGPFPPRTSGLSATPAFASAKMGSTT
jgi:hypothetical protein